MSKDKTGLFPGKTETIGSVTIQVNGDPGTLMTSQAGVNIVPAPGNLPVPFDPTQMAKEFFPVEANMEAMTGAPQLPQITIVKEIGKFKMPDDETKKEFYGVIAAIQPARGFWPSDSWPDKDPALKGTTIPSCYSLDGIIPSVKCNWAKECRNCPMNEWGSARLANPEKDESNGKGCKDSRKIAVHLLGDTLEEARNANFQEIINQDFPYLLVAPPSSIKRIEAFLNKLLGSKPRLSFNLVIARFTLLPIEGKKFKYCEISLERVGDVLGQFQSADMFQGYRDKCNDFKAYLKGTKLEHSDVIDDPTATLDGQPF